MGPSTLKPKEEEGDNIEAILANSPRTLKPAIAVLGSSDQCVLEGMVQRVYDQDDDFHRRLEDASRYCHSGI